MPTYEYRCPLGHEFEVVQRITERRPRTKCPVCGRIAERQLSGGAGLIFKGSGFYITDYGKDGKGPRKEPEGESKKPETAPAAEKKDAPASAPAPSTDSDKPVKKKAKPSE
jgi:putative FmdB family regulatory protein